MARIYRLNQQNEDRKTIPFWYAIYLLFNWRGLLDLFLYLNFSMTLTELIEQRVLLYEEMNDKLRHLRLDYEPKLAAINLQIEREGLNGIKKRINAAMNGKTNGRV